MQPAISQTAIHFTPDFYHRLEQIAQSQGKPLNRCVEELMNPLLEQLEQQRLQRLYDGLSKLCGIIQDGPSDASSTIDEYLYGWGDAAPPAEEHG